MLSMVDAQVDSLVSPLLFLICVHVLSWNYLGTSKSDIFL